MISQSSENWTQENERSGREQKNVVKRTSATKGRNQQQEKNEAGKD
jgi:hypothetical protein